MGFGLPFSLTLFILLQTLLIVQVFFYFLPANGLRFADSKRLKAYGPSSQPEIQRGALTVQ